jgi:hypothetical protein
MYKRVTYILLLLFPGAIAGVVNRPCEDFLA